MQTPPILIIGKQGQVAWELQRTLAPLGQIAVLGSQDLDLSDPDQIQAQVRRVQPQIIVNAAAYTAVDKAESEAELCMAINGTAPGILAELARQSQALLVHYSTDYVFDGTKTSPYLETDSPNPLGVYGATKLAGEQAIAQVDCAHLILRTTWVYGDRGKNFLLTILRLARERAELKIVADQLGAPTWSRAIAEATAQILVQRQQDDWAVSGLYHLSASGITSWYGFAREIIAQYQALYPEQALMVERILPISTSEYPTPAQRPANSVLDNSKLLATFGLQLPDWPNSLTQVLSGIKI